MYHTDLRFYTTTFALIFLAGCAGGASSISSGANSKSVLPAAVSQAMTTASLASCSVIATALGQGGSNRIQQAVPISSSDTWFLEQDLGSGVLSVDHAVPGAAHSTVLKPFGMTRVVGAFMQAFTDNDIWVVGNSGGYTGTYLLVAHWDGARWSQVTLSGPNSAHFSPRALSGLSTNDLWISGENDYAAGNARHLELAHWNGATLSVVAVEPYPGNAGPLLEFSPANIWAVTDGYENQIYAAQWNGSRWGTTHVLPAVPGQTEANVVPVQMAATGPDNIWLIGLQGINVGTPEQTYFGRIWRYNGQWQPYVFTQTGSESIFQGVAPLDEKRTVISASNGPGITLYGYSGSDRFHSIPNDLPQYPFPAGPLAIVPGTSHFWEPTMLSSTSDAMDLVSCQ